VTAEKVRNEIIRLLSGRRAEKKDESRTMLAVARRLQVVLDGIVTCLHTANGDWCVACATELGEAIGETYKALDPSRL
jgi:hypothetical protein